METYKKMYFQLFNQVTDAIAQMEELNFGAAKSILMAAQIAAEEVYINNGNGDS